MTSSSLVRLEHESLLRLDDRVGDWLEVLSGALWLTEQGDPHDHCLHAGDRHRVSSPGRVLAQACGGEPVWLRWERGEPRGEPQGERRQERTTRDAPSAAQAAFLRR